MIDYLKYSFKPNFLLNQREIEPFECPKLLGDVFESFIGAIFVDGGMESVIDVMKHFLGPFVLYAAKFSKLLYKEPKEEFLWMAIENKIRPKFRI